MKYDKISRINDFNSLKSIIISCIDEKNVDISYAINPLNEYVNGLLLEIKELKDVIKEYKKKANIYYYEELKKTRVLLKKEYAENVSLKAELVTLKYAENVSLKAEIESLQDQLKECVNDYENDIKDNEVIKEVEEELYKSYKKNKPSKQRSI